MIQKQKDLRTDSRSRALEAVSDISRIKTSFKNQLTLLEEWYNTDYEPENEDEDVSNDLYRLLVAYKSVVGELQSVEETIVEKCNW